MMKKGTLIALVLFAALLVAVVFTQKRKPERGIARVSFAEVQKDAIDRLEVKGKNPIEMKKQDGKWILGDGKPAEENAVKRALEAIPQIQSSDHVTANADRYKELEVDDEKGTRVAAWAGGRAVAEFVLGKSAEGGAYVRKGDGVWTVKQVQAYLFSKPSSAWHQLKLFTDLLDDVSRVEVSLASGTPYALVKKDGKWALDDLKVVPAGFRFDESAARSLASAAVNLTAKDILEKDPGAEATKLDKEFDVVAFVGKENARREIRLGAALADKTVYAQVSGKPDVYTLPEWTAKNLRKKALDLREMTLMAVEREKVKKLEVVSGKTQLVLEKQGAEWKIGKSSEPIPADFELDPMAAERRVSSFAGARGLKIAAGAAPAETGLAKPSATLTATLEDGKTVALLFGAATKNDAQDAFFAKGNADSESYLVAKWTHDELTNGLTALKKRPEPKIDPSQLQNLPPEVRAGLMQQLQQKQQQERMLQAIQAQEKAKAAPKK